MVPIDYCLSLLLTVLYFRAMSYQMAGNFLAACNEHEAAVKLVADGDVLPPEPQLALSMDINRGIRCASKYHTYYVLIFVTANTN